MMVMGHHAKGRGNVDGTDRQYIYVHHLKTGCDRNEETQTLVLQVSEIMSTGGFVSSSLLTFGGSASGRDKPTVESPRPLLEPPERQTLWRSCHPAEIHPLISIYLIRRSVHHQRTEVALDRLTNGHQEMLFSVQNYIYHLITVKTNQ
ncbi:hypothetical protein T06_14281 [Trichinella sp. T6]|nr:hypothetical protein T06_14281 [Trichinella sp. T6]